MSTSEIEKLPNLSDKEKRTYSISRRIANRDDTFACCMSDTQVFENVTHRLFTKFGRMK